MRDNRNKVFALAFLLVLALACLASYYQGGPLTSATSSTGNITASSTDCKTTNSCIFIHLPSNTASLTVTTSGTFTGTLQYEVSADNQLTWNSVGSVSIPGATTWPMAAQTDFRVRASAMSSGSANIMVVNSQAAMSGVLLTAGVPSSCQPTQINEDSTTGGLYGCVNGIPTLYPPTPSVTSLYGTTGSFGGGLLLAGACATGTASVTGAVVGEPVSVAPSDGTNIAALGANLTGTVTSANTVTVSVCALVAITPPAKTYKVVVHV